MTDWIAQLCAHVGVHAGYRGFDGQPVTATAETQIAVLRAMGLDAATEPQARDILLTLQDAQARHPMPREVIVQAGTSAQVTVAHPCDWVLEAEDTNTPLASGSALAEITLPALPMGIHRLRLRSGGVDFTACVLARPSRAVTLEDRLPAPRIWGVLAALYGLTEGDAAPIGSYAHLGAVAASLAIHGADFLGINPIHAMGTHPPDGLISPYSPSHRGFLNTWHCTATGRGSHAELVDYSVSLQANADALAAQYTDFSALPAAAMERQAFGAFTKRSGVALEDYALFETLSAKLGPDWRIWPEAYRNREPDTLRAFARAHKDAITQTKWAQWQAETQLAEAQSRAQNAGMRIGLYLDLAVGPRLGGAESWAADTPLITGATLGAPPDPLGPEGQSWGLAPLCPLKSRAEGFAGFARLLRAIMRHAGMIRIDHVLGLMRSFWIPEGHRQGTYVSQPFEALLAVTAIESQRAGTIVVGEDLGLVPEGLRDALSASGIYGLDVLQYMRTSKGGFVDTGKTRALAICGFATHDTPTIAGFFAAEDATQRHALGSIDADMLAATRADRARAQAALNGDAPVQAVHKRLAKAAASMVSVQLDDVAGRIAQQNLPGTVDAYPNWRLKAPFTAQQIKTSDAFAQLGAQMRAQGRSNSLQREKAHDLSDH